MPRVIERVGSVSETEAPPRAPEPAPAAEAQQAEAAPLPTRAPEATGSAPEACRTCLFHVDDVVCANAGYPRRCRAAAADPQD